MALEDKVLALIERAPATYDGIRGELGCLPGELDEVIQRLLRSRLIQRDKGRFTTIDTQPLETTVVTPADSKEEEESVGGATLRATKVCSKCEKRKPREAFSKRSAAKDGLQTWCKECTSGSDGRGTRTKRKATKPAARLPRAAGQKGCRPAPAIATSVRAEQVPARQISILHFHDGVRIGPLVTSDAGIAQMPYHVDLSAEQLDELCGWWTACREKPRSAGDAR